jgi:peptidoglycan/xylan/chitin deacetylase (PgdA/CDA1 family)
MDVATPHPASAGPGTTETAAARDPRRLAKSILTAGLPYALLKARALRKNPITLLCYHTLRPDAEPLDAWTAVRESDFVRQMQFLRAHYDVVSLDEAFAEEEAHGKRPRAVVTFDDGEVGLYDTLLSLLAEMRLPVTLYIATGQIEDGRPYWFDEVMNVLQADGPFTIDLTAEDAGAWTIGPRKGKARWGAIASILEALKSTEPARRAALAATIVAQAPAMSAQAFKPLQPLSVAQLREVAGSEWVTIAAHSHCHNLLDQLPADDVRESVARSRTLLEGWTGRPVHHFAYPNGNHNRTVEAIVSDLGFRSAVALDDRLWHRGMDRFALPRISIGRYDDFDRFKLRLVEV